MKKKMLEDLKHNHYDASWLKSYYEKDVFERIETLRQWGKFEDYSVFDCISSIEELEEMFLFVQCGVGVNFVVDVYETIDEELEDGDRTTLNLLRKFNKAMEQEVIPY